MIPMVPIFAMDHMRDILLRRHASGTLPAGIEFRFGVQNNSMADGRKVFGQAAVYDQPSEDLGGFVEVFAKGAFSQSLNDPKFDGRVLFNHSHACVLGRCSAHTARFTDSSSALLYEADLPDTSWARDLLTSMERNDITGSGVAFFVFFSIFFFSIDFSPVLFPLPVLL
jgi:HK97 family phage prohead protease